MKTLLNFKHVLLSLLISFLLMNKNYSQRLESSVPIIVNDSFQKRFPDKDPVWFSTLMGKYDKRLVYEARFMMDNRYTKAFYENEGTLIAFASTIEESELPERIREYMKENYPTLPIVESLLVTHIKNGIHYEVGVYIDGDFVVMTFSKEGQYLKTELR